MDIENDPILTPEEMAKDGNISLATWRRTYRHNPKLKLLRISPRRFGARRSDWRRAVEQNTEQAA